MTLPAEQEAFLCSVENAKNSPLEVGVVRERKGLRTGRNAQFDRTHAAVVEFKSQGDRGAMGIVKGFVARFTRRCLPQAVIERRDRPGRKRIRSRGIFQAQALDVEEGGGRVQDAEGPSPFGPIQGPG